MPDVAKNQDLTLQDIRVIIHGLKMSGFANIEPEALDQIKFRIKSLPEPEELNDLSDDILSLKRIAKEVGEIMRLLEIYGKKGAEYKARFESQKGMPPRYKVLEWRKANMNNTDFVRQVVKLSAKVDFEGHADVAKKLNSLAKTSLEQNASQSDIDDVVQALSKINMQKEAIGIRDWWKNRGQTKKNMKQEHADLNLLTNIQSGILKARQQLFVGLQGFQQSIEAIQNMTKKINEPNRRAKAEQIVNQFNINIEGMEMFEDEAVQQNTATLQQMMQEIGGQTYVNKTPVEAPAAAPAPVAEAPAAPVGPELPAGLPVQVTDPRLAAQLAQYFQRFLETLPSTAPAPAPAPATASSKKVIKLAQAAPAAPAAPAAQNEQQAWTIWFQENRNNRAALEEAIRYLQEVSGGVAVTPSPMTSVQGTDIGTTLPPTPPPVPAAPKEPISNKGYHKSFGKKDHGIRMIRIV